MKSFFKIFTKAIKWTAIIAASLIILALIVRFIGQRVHARTPEGGINESMYVDINDSKQWINIYGQDINNPVLLFLHGGPGGALSYEGYPVLRKISDIYTVVYWDQRACGLSWSEDQAGTHVSFEQLFEDGEAMTKFLLDYFGVEKISVMGVSWGAVFGANLVLDHPEYYDRLYALSLIVDGMETQKAYKEMVLELTKDNPQMHAIAENILTEQSQYDALTYDEQIAATLEQAKIDEKYQLYDSYDADFNTGFAMFFNPYYSLKDYYNLFRSTPMDIDSLDESYCYNYLLSSGSYEIFSVLDRTEYEVPVYIIMGDKDYNVMTSVTRQYFETINAPYKEYFEVEGGHGAPMLNSEEFRQIIHGIVAENGY